MEQKMHDRVAEVACNIYTARDAVYGIKQIADYAVENDAGNNMDMNAITTFAEMVENILQENADRLQAIADELRRA